MKTVIRNSTFETNSSSSHAITFKTKEDSQFELYQKRLREIKYNDERLHILVGACQLKMQESFYELSDVFYKKVDIYEIEYTNVTAALKESENKNEFIDKCKNVKEMEYVIPKASRLLRHDPYARFVNRHKLFDNYFKFKEYRDEVIKAFAKIEGMTPKNVVDEYDLDNMRGEPICTRLFNRNPLGDCNCGVESVFNLIETKYANMTDLANAIFNEELTLFTCESWQSCTCDIERVLKGEEDNWN